MVEIRDRDRIQPAVGLCEDEEGASTFTPEILRGFGVLGQLPITPY